MGAIVALLAVAAVNALDGSPRYSVAGVSNLATLNEEIPWAVETEIQPYGGFFEADFYVARYWVFSSSYKEELGSFLSAWYATKNIGGAGIGFCIHDAEGKPLDSLGYQAQIGCGIVAPPSQREQDSD